MCTEGEEATTKLQRFVMAGNKKADTLAKDGADADGGQMAAARALAIKLFRKEIDASIELAARFHVQIEEWQNRDEIVQKKGVVREKESM